MNDSQIKDIAHEIKNSLKQYPDFPSKGILFEDIMPIFANADLFNKLLNAFELHLRDKKVDFVVGLESRGFLFGPALALKLGAGFVPVRKPGKLPGETYVVEFQKEYGTDKFEVQRGAIHKNAKVVIVDDILATGGSAEGAGKLMKQAEADVVEYLFISELDFLKGRKKLDSSVFTLLSSQPSSLQL